MPDIEHRSLCATYHFNVFAETGDILKVSGLGRIFPEKSKAAKEGSLTVAMCYQRFKKIMTSSGVRIGHCTAPWCPE